MLSISLHTCSNSEVDPLGLVEMRMQVDTSPWPPFVDLDIFRCLTGSSKKGISTQTPLILPRGKKVPTRVRTGDLMRVKHA